MRKKISVIYHLGAPFTDKDQITWSLRRDTHLLRENGVMLRRPGEYRNMVSGMVKKLDGNTATEEEQETLLGAIVKNQKIDRLILSNPNFIGEPAQILNGGTLFQNAGPNVRKLRRLFPDNPCELFLGIRNPATLISEAFSAQNVSDFNQFTDGADLQALRWSDVIARIQQINPGCPVTIWSNEDTPTIWSRVLGAITAIDPEKRFAGEMDVIRAIMSEEGAVRLEKYLEEQPQLSESQRQNVCGIFLEKYVLNDAVEDEIDLPGLTNEVIERMSDDYEADLQVIADMPGVTYISPFNTFPLT